MKIKILKDNEKTIINLKEFKKYWIYLLQTEIIKELGIIVFKNENELTFVEKNFNEKEKILLILEKLKNFFKSL